MTTWSAMSRLVGFSCLLIVACKSSSPPSAPSAAADAGTGQGAGIRAGAGGASQPVAPAADGGKVDNPGDTIPVTPSTGNQDTPGCNKLQCQQHKCASGSTTISGRVYDPAGKNPLYNVAVYVPNAELQPIALGASCAPCDALFAKAVVSTLTDADGRFTLKDAPDGDNIPLVIQIGKWRRQFKLPSVTQCGETKVPDKQLMLPRNHTEGDIPNIAISTGAADTLECLLRRVGIDASEYTPGPDGQGRVHIFQGSPGNGRGTAIAGSTLIDPPNMMPPGPRSTASLWDSAANLKKYDVLLLSCEGQETAMMNQQALHDYASGGGRVFASHFHYSWFNTGPYGSENLATWTPGSNHIDDISATIVTSFPKGEALSKWLMTTNALVNGELPIKEARHNADVTAANKVSQTWISANQAAKAPGATQYFSFNTPTSAANTADGAGYCGRVVFSDLHVGAASADDATKPVPTSCSNVDLSPQEKALEFMLFDLSSCVIPDDRPPVPPPALN